MTPPSTAEQREIDRLAKEIERLKPLVAEILAELGLKALLGQLPGPF